MYVFTKGNVVVAITSDSSGLPDYDSMCNISDIQKVSIGDTIVGGIFYDKNNIPSYCLTKLEFLNRFTIQELAVMEASTDPVVKVLQRQQELAEFIDLQDQKVLEGLMYLNTIGILTQDRISEIMVANV